MSLDAPLAEYEVRGGAHRGTRLTLYGNRVACHGADAMEVVQLSQLAAVRVGFERDAGKLGWAIGLGVAALALAAAARPLQSLARAAIARLGAGSRGESLDAVLHASFDALDALARLLPAFAGGLGLLAAGFVAFFWLGRTRLSLSFAAVEREFAVRGRDRDLAAFAESVADRLAARKDA